MTLKTLEPRKIEPLTTEVIPEILNLNRVLSGQTFDSLSINTKKTSPVPGVNCHKTSRHKG
jgi:hypothetical protein